MKIWHWIILGLLTVASVVAGFLDHGHGHGGDHIWSNPFFWIVFGAAGCAVLIVFAKMVLGPIIYKKEDYYNE